MVNRGTQILQRWLRNVNNAQRDRRPLIFITNCEWQYYMYNYWTRFLLHYEVLRVTVKQR